MGNKLINFYKKLRNLGIQTKRELFAESVFPLD